MSQHENQVPETSQQEEETQEIEQPTPLPEIKPKRQLTEAQKLAFEKGRAKRLANLEKKRQESIEAEAAGLKREVPIKTPSPIDYDKLADKVVNKIKQDMPPPAPIKRKYERKAPPSPIAPPPVAMPSPQLPVVPPRVEFNWM